eukprot:6198975-Pleurochrysis_carterae.AAC.1
MRTVSRFSTRVGLPQRETTVDRQGCSRKTAHLARTQHTATFHESIGLCLHERGEMGRNGALTKKGKKRIWSKYDGIENVFAVGEANCAALVAVLCICYSIDTSTSISTSTIISISTSISNFIFISISTSISAPVSAPVSASAQHQHQHQQGHGKPLA